MKNVILLILIILISSLYGEIILEHQGPLTLKPDEPFVLTLKIRDGFNEIYKTLFFYRGSGALSYSEIEMEKGTESNPVFTIASSNIINFETGLEYYFEVYDENDKLVTLPEMRPEINPFRVAIEKSTGFSDLFVRLSPDPELSDITEDFIIAISLFAISDDLNYDSVKLIFDGKDVTSSSTISKNMLIYNVTKSKQGKHSYQISGELLSGEKIISNLWITEVESKRKEFPLNLTGNVAFRTKIHTVVDSLGDGVTDDRYDFLMNLRGKYKLLGFRSKLSVSSMEDKNKQPVNRYNIAFNVPYFEVVGGDLTPNYGTFTATGKNIRGIHGKFTVSSFKIISSYGNSYRSINGKAYVDSTENGQEITNYTNGTFQRKTFAVRTEVGSQSGFLCGLSFSKTKDKLSSLNEKYYISQTDSLPTVKPKDNLVLALDTRLALLNQRLVFGAEGAMSLYNNNIIDGTISKDSLEADIGHSIPFDPETWKNIFIINKNVEPIIPNLSNFAYKTYLRIYLFRNLLNFSFTGIGASFNSLSANYLPIDAKILSIIDNFTLMDNQLAINLSFNYISDNLYDEKEVTSKSTNYFAQLFYRPPGQPYFGISYCSNISKNNYKSEEENGSSYIDRSLDINSGNFAFSIGYPVNKIVFAPTTFSFNFNTSFNKDEAAKLFDYKKNYLTLTAKSEFMDLPLTTTLVYSFSINDNINRTYDENTGFGINPVKIKSNYNSIYLKGAFSFGEDKLKPYIDFRYSIEEGDVSKTSQMFNLGSNYDIGRKTFMNAEFGMVFYEDNDIENSKVSHYNFRFKIKQKF